MQIEGLFEYQSVSVVARCLPLGAPSSSSSSFCVLVSLIEPLLQMATKEEPPKKDEKEAPSQITLLAKTVLGPGVYKRPNAPDEHEFHLKLNPEQASPLSYRNPADDLLLRNRGGRPATARLRGHQNREPTQLSLLLQGCCVSPEEARGAGEMHIRRVLPSGAARRLRRSEGLRLRAPLVPEQGVSSGMGQGRLRHCRAPSSISSPSTAPSARTSPSRRKSTGRRASLKVSGRGRSTLQGSLALSPTTTPLRRVANSLE